MYVCRKVKNIGLDTNAVWVDAKKERKKADKPREGWEDGTPPPHRDFKERGVVR